MSNASNISVPAYNYSYNGSSTGQSSNQFLCNTQPSINWQQNANMGYVPATYTCASQTIGQATSGQLGVANGGKV